MKNFSILLLISLLTTTQTYADVLECQPADTNYSVTIFIETNNRIMGTPVFLGDIYASVNDDPGDVLHNNITIYNNSQYLYTTARGEDELTGAQTLFAVVIDVANSNGHYYYGAAILRSNIDSDLPSDSEALSYLIENLHSSNGSGLVECHITP
jgi:hypothetical protein